MSDDFFEDFIRRVDYMVKISSQEELELTVEYTNQRTDIYRVVVDEEGNVYGICHQYGDKEEYVPMHVSAIRLYIMLDVYRQCSIMKLPTDIIRCFKDGVTIEYTDLFAIPMDEDSSGAEVLMEGWLSEYMSGDMDLITCVARAEDCGLRNVVLQLAGMVPV